MRYSAMPASCFSRGRGARRNLSTNGGSRIRQRAADFSTRRLGAGGEGDSGRRVAAVAVGVLRQVLLVVVLGEVERAGRHDLGGDVAVAALPQPRREGRPRLLGGLSLGVRRDVDRRAVLRADVVALAEALRRVVLLPEHLE